MMKVTIHNQGPTQTFDIVVAKVSKKSLALSISQNLGKELSTYILYI